MYQNSTAGSTSPHIYQLAETAYRRMVVDHTSQAVIISGESGAGKVITSLLIILDRICEVDLELHFCSVWKFRKHTKGEGCHLFDQSSLGILRKCQNCEKRQLFAIRKVSRDLVHGNWRTFWRKRH